MSKIVIVGGGFAGVATAQHLRKNLPAGWEVVLFSKLNHFVMTPLLPEVIGAQLKPGNAARPIREMTKGISCRTAPVIGLDPEDRQITYEGGNGKLEKESYDHLVLSVGLEVNMNIVPGMADYGWPVKIYSDAASLGNRLVQQLERAEIEDDPEVRSGLLSFAVVGGGFTGVEVAGSIMDLLKGSTRFYDRIDSQDIRVTIVDGGPRILGPMPESLSAFATRKMRQNGIEIHSGVRVEEVCADGIRLAGGDFVAAGLVVSAVGNTIQPLIAKSDLPLVRNRIKVGGDLRVEGYQNVWALGDCAAVPNEFDNTISPTLAQFATRQAKLLARNLTAVIMEQSTSTFYYKTQGLFATIGHRNAVGNVFGILRISGLLGYLMWHAVYWAWIPTFGRKVQIAFDWFMNLFMPPDLLEVPLDTTLQRLPGREKELELELLQGDNSQETPREEIHGS